MKKLAILYAFIAAFLYALNAPMSKLLLEKISPILMASFLYLGAGIGVLLIFCFQRINLKVSRNPKLLIQEESLAKKDLPYIVAMIVLDVAAPIFLMTGLRFTTSANAALLNNFEIVATSFIAFSFFKEKISQKLWIGIIFITIASIVLSFEDIGHFSNSITFSKGSILVLLACVCWGFENNCTKKLSVKNPLQIVIIKGLCSGLISLILALLQGERINNISTSYGYILFALVLGFFAYGLSISFYIYAQRNLGAAKTSSYYAVSPFIGSALSLIIFKQIPSVSFLIAVIIMCIGTYLVTKSS